MRPSLLDWCIGVGAPVAGLALLAWATARPRRSHHQDDES